MSTKLNNLKVAILVADNFEQVEMTKPREALEKAGAKVYLISPKKTVKGCHHDKPGDEFSVDVLLDDANANDYGALLLPGGVFNPDHLRTLPNAIHFIHKIVAAQKPVAAICHGPWTLINAEAVKGRTLTSWPSIKVDLMNAGAHWVDKEVVRDGNLVTSRKPGDIPAFNQAMIELFSEAI
ncbi:MAG TPA: type 1 glutamine amidotransferase domain-containing protein [Gammaproteobacteria bacterium]|nr:type 1 glutamine amidotransferase domain-containing protein [Gammaproteobacteria bacterium]